MKSISLFLALFLLISCDQKNKISVDTIITDATIYSVDNSFGIASAMAIDKGKIVAIGTNGDISKQYESKNTIDGEGKFIYPGLIDAHCHFYSYGLSLQEADLRGTKSMAEIITRLKAFQKDKNPTFIVGNGWDQNDWKVKKYPQKLI